MINTKAILNCLDEMKTSIEGRLFTSVTKNNAISNQLVSFRAIYLTGEGSFMDDFLDKYTQLKSKMDASFIPLNTNGIQSLEI